MMKHILLLALLSVPMARADAPRLAPVAGSTFRLCDGVTILVNNPKGAAFTLGIDVRDLNLFENGPREVLLKVYDPDGKTLVREVVARGRDPRTTALAEIVEPPNATLDPAMPLVVAYAFLERHDLERVPVVESGRLVGVLSRSVVQRRLAEDEPGDAVE